MTRHKEMNLGLASNKADAVDDFFFFTWRGRWRIFWGRARRRRLRPVAAAATAAVSTGRAASSARRWPPGRRGPSTRPPCWPKSWRSEPKFTTTKKTTLDFRKESSPGTQIANQKWTKVFHSRCCSKGRVSIGGNLPPTLGNTLAVEFPLHQNLFTTHCKISTLKGTKYFHSRRGRVSCFPWGNLPPTLGNT